MHSECLWYLIDANLEEKVGEIISKINKMHSWKFFIALFSINQCLGM
jgi:hypothetical protein